jgi:hypothetical protein
MADKDDKNKPSLYNPNSILTDEALRRAARAYAKLEYRPQIDAYRDALKANNKAQRRDLRGLSRLGRRTENKSNRASLATAQLLKNGLVNTRDLGNRMREMTAENQGAADSRMEGLQSSVLGKQLASQQTTGLGPGLAESAAADSMVADQSRMSGLAGAFAQGTNVQATGMEDMARNRLQSHEIGRRERRDAIRNAVLARSLDTRAEYGAEGRKIRGELKTAKSLRGALFMQKLMELRDSERRYGNEKRALNIDAKANNQDYKLGLKNSKDGGGDGPDDWEEGSPRDLARMGPTEWKEWLAAVNQERLEGDPTIAPGSLQRFIGGALKDADLDLSGRERRQFTRRYRNWYNKQDIGPRLG